jgi:origin recognition complex subunit 5
MAACLDARDLYTGGKVDRRPYARTESLNTLAVSLGRMIEEWDGLREEGGKFVLVFDGIDKQREAPPTLLPALARFAELVCIHPILPLHAKELY